MTKNQGEPKIGAGHASAMFRQGLSELRGALYADSNVAQSPQYGLYGTKTPGEVAESRRTEGAERDEEPGVHGQDRVEEPGIDATARDADAPSVVGERLADAEKEPRGPKPEHPEPERD